MTATHPPVTVTDADVATFKDRGYWISPKLFSDEQIAQIRAEIERLMRGEKDTDGWGWSGPVACDPEAKHMFQVVNAWWVNHRIRAAVTSSAIGYIASRLLETPAVQLLHDQALVKPGLGAAGAQSLEGNFGWHQDYAYWDYVDTENLCTCWVALQDTDLSNGAMRTIVGSHQWGYNPDSGAAGEKNLDGLRERFAKHGQDWLDEPCLMQAGQASFHHALTYHGSGPNTSDQPGMSIVSHLMPAGSTYDPSGKWNRLLTLLGPDLKAGDPFAGPCFPQVWPVA